MRVFVREGVADHALECAARHTHAFDARVGRFDPLQDAAIHLQEGLEQVRRHLRLQVRCKRG